MGSNLTVHLRTIVNSLMQSGETIIREYSAIDPRGKSPVPGILPEETGAGITLTNQRAIISKVTPRAFFNPGQLRDLDRRYAGRNQNNKVFIDATSFYYDQISAAVVNRGAAVTLQIFRQGETVKPVVMSLWNVSHAQTIENACLFRDMETALVFQQDIEARMKNTHTSQQKSGSSSSYSLAEQINQLASLRQQGILTESEFQAAKKKLLS